MKKMKIIYALGISMILLVLLLIRFSNNKLNLDFDGYGFYQEPNGKGDFETKRIEVKIDANINDSNLSNDRIEINYDDIRIVENILFQNKEEIWTGNIVHYDQVNAEDQILGSIVLINKGEECFISLYNKKLDIVAPVEDINIATEKYIDFYIKNSEYKIDR